jgi:hypothetical protein
MLKQAVSTEKSVVPEQQAVAAHAKAVPDVESDNEADLESLWTPVALSLAMTDRDSDG